MTLLTRLFKPAPSSNAPTPPDLEQAPMPAAPPIEPAELSAVAQAAEANDTATLCKFAIEGASTKVRQAAADAIQDPAQLKALLKDVRGKDKNVYKIIRAKCDALLAQEKAAAETQAAIEHLSVALERHSHLPFDSLFTPTLDHLNAQWDAVAAHASPDIAAKTERAIERCRETISEHLRKVAAQAAHEAALANADTNRLLVLDELRALLASAFGGDTVTDKLNALRERWHELAQFKAPDARQAADHRRLQNAIESVAATIAAQGSLTALTQSVSQNMAEQTASDAVARNAQTLEQLLTHAALLNDAVPAAVSEAATQLNAYKQARAEREAAKSNAIRQLGSLIRKANGALAAGKTGPAAGLRRAIEEKIAHASEMPAHLTNQLQQLDEKLQLLQDWRSYAVAPKRIELIEQMEALSGSEAEPNALAERIRKLQDEWKTISKGNTDDTDAEWQRFHQAAQTAYQPCKEYFAAQAKQRQSNLEKRKALLERLERFAAAQHWDQPDWQADWKEIAKALRESRQQWRNHQPVDRSANKPLQAQFDAIGNALQSRLDAECAKNAKEKQRLIAAAERAISMDDGRQAADEVKKLQSLWKNIGPAARDEEQKLWEEFRRHCDAVFAKRHQAHTEHRASLEAAKDQAIALCADAERIATLSGAELIEGLKTLPALREAFAALGELPRASARELQTRFERGVASCDRKLAEQRARDKASAWNAVLDAGDKLRAYRLALLNGVARSEELKQAVLDFCDAVAQWPKGGLQAVKAELAKSPAADLSANEAAMRTLCIRAEILTGAPTPDSDKDFRREYQMQRLKQTMGQGQSHNKDELDAMVLEWIATGPVDDVAYAPLIERFKRCRAR